MGHAEMNKITDTPARIHLTSGQDHQNYQEIKRAEVTELYRTIGTYQTPTGQMDKITDTPARIHLTSGQDHQNFQEIKRAEVTDPY